MPVMVRLSRLGAKKTPQYRIVAINGENARNGKCLEILGTFIPSPLGKQEEFSIKADRVQHWLDLGAHLSPTVNQLLKKKGVKLARKSA